jgi:hypothetical protein
MEEGKEEIKKITYSNGSVLTKRKTKSQEIWELDNKSLSEIKFTMDLSKCENVHFSKDEDKKSKTLKIPCGRKKRLFTLVKTPPFVMNPIFHKKETPIDLEEQK